MNPPAALFQFGMAGFAGPCTRCEMVCMDQTTGLKVGPEPLLTLASFRLIKGRILFGILLTHHPSPQPQQWHMKALQQGPGDNERPDPAQMRQQLNSALTKGDEVNRQASDSCPSTQPTAQRSLEAYLFPVLRVGMPLLSSM